MMVFNESVIHPNMSPRKISVAKYIFQPLIFKGHVSFQGSNFNQTEMLQINQQATVPTWQPLILLRPLRPLTAAGCGVASSSSSAGILPVIFGIAPEVYTP